jgi:hypothetical protein
MMKRFFFLLLCAVCLISTACAEGMTTSAGNTVALADTGYRIAVPDGWTTATQPDRRAAVAEAASTDGSAHILAFVSEQPGWRLTDWKAALLKGSRTNSVTDISGFTIGDRPWVGYRLTIGTANVYAAATTIGDGLFLTVEFRALNGDLPEAAFPEGTIDQCLASLTADP